MSRLFVVLVTHYWVLSRFRCNWARPWLGMISLVQIRLIQQPLDRDQGQRSGAQDQRQDHCPRNAG